MSDREIATRPQTPPSLEALFHELNSKTLAPYRTALREFAEFRSFARADYMAALEALFDMERDQVLAVIDGFKDHLNKGKLNPNYASRQVITIKTAIRRAHAAGLTPLDIDKKDAPGRLEASVFQGLNPTSIGQYRAVIMAFAEFRSFARADYMAALEALFDMERDQVLAVIDGFEAHLNEGKPNPGYVKHQVTLIRTAIRKAHVDGLTVLDIDKKDAPGRLEAALFHELKPRSIGPYRTTLREFAEFRSFARADYMAALEALFDMERDQVLAVIDGFEAHLNEGRLNPDYAVRGIGVIRTLIRKAKKAGLTTLNLGEPFEEDAPGSLKAALFHELKPKAATCYRTTLREFAEFRSFARADYMAAFRTLLKMELDQVLVVLGEFRGHLNEGKHTSDYVNHQVIRIKTAIRRAHAAGLTPLDIDKPSEEDAPDSLRVTLFCGLTPITALHYRTAFMAFAEFRSFARADYMAAFRTLLKMERDQVLAVLGEFKARQIEGGRSKLTAWVRASMIRTALRKAKKSGLTTLNFGEPNRSAGPRRPAVDNRRILTSRNSDRDNFCIQLREQGKSYGDIAKAVELRTEWVPLAGRQAVRDAIKRRCEVLGRPIPRVADEL